MDCLAQTVDRALSGQTVDRLRKAWIKLAQARCLARGLALSGHLTCAGLRHHRVTARRVHVGGGKIPCFGRLTLMARWVASLGRVADSRLLVFVRCCKATPSGITVSGYRPHEICKI